MKKILILIITIVGILLPLNANALSGNVTVSCAPTKLNPGETANCSIKANVQGGEVSSLHAKINTGTNLTLGQVTVSSIWAGDGDGGIIDLYTDTNKTSAFDIATFTVTAKTGVYGATSTVSLSEVALYDKAFNENKFTANTVNITHPSNINTLSALSISGATINFDPNTTTYSATIDSSSTTINATATDAKASILGAGTKSLNYGTNKLDIVVTAENGTQKTYTINVTRPDNRSKDNNLSSLKLNNGTINFVSSTTTYNVTVDDASTTITATAKDSKSTVSGAGTKNLNYGTNKFDIVVTAENGTQKTYTVNVTRKDNRDSNNYLSSLKTTVGQVDFYKEKTNYSLSVSNNITEVTITATAASQKSTVAGAGTKNLVEGENSFIIKVTAENQSVKEYKIIIIREKVETVTTNNNLKKLTITDHNIDFNPDTKEYTIKTEKSTLDIIVELENSEATYEVIGNEDLHDGSIIQIIVTDKEGNNNIYRINIDNPNEVLESEETSKDEQKEPTTNYVPIIMISIFIILLVITIILFIRWKKYRKEKTI